MNQQNTNTNAGTTDPSSGAVYTSGTNSQQGPGVQAGAVYTSGVGTSGTTTNVNTGSLGSTGSTGSMGSAGTMGSTGTGNTGGGSNVQQIRQQLQNIQTQLRQSQGNGTVSEEYTNAANRIQDVYEILGNIR